MIGIDAFADGFAFGTGLFRAFVGEGDEVGNRGVGQAKCRGVGNCGRHVGDAVVENAVDVIDGAGMGGGAGGFEAASLIDGDINDPIRASFGRSCRDALASGRRLRG